MPNAKDLDQAELGHNILLLGYTGSGKTSQLLTLPGKTFCYIFDPSSVHTLAGHDIEYEDFIPTKLNIAAKSLTKGKSDKGPLAKETDVQELYTTFAKELERKIESGFFDDFDNICLDSFTTLSDLVMDRVMFLNGRLGEQPQQDDWGAQMVTIKSLVRELVGLNKRMVFTGHIEFKQDEGGTGRMMNIIRLTGNLRTLIPILFSDVLICDYDTKDGGYILRTRKDRYNPQVRCTMRTKDGKTLPEIVNVSIPDSDWSDPRGKFGLGSLILSTK